MRIKYSYDVSGAQQSKKTFTINPDPIQPKFDNLNQITYEYLINLLESDGVALNNQSTLLYYSKPHRTYLHFPKDRPLPVEDELQIQIKEGYSQSSYDLISEINFLSKNCEEVKIKLEERDLRIKSINKNRESGAQAPCKDLDIVMLHASPLTHNSSPFEKPTMNFLQEIQMMTNFIDHSASIRFEIATPENLKELLEYHSKIIIISCEGLINDQNEFVLAVEKLDKPSEIGEVFEMSTGDVKKLLDGNRFNQIAIVKSKEFREIGKIFSSVGMSIVMAVEERDDNEAMEFIVDLVNSLLSGKTVLEFLDEAEINVKYEVFARDDSIIDQSFFSTEKKGSLEVMSEEPRFKLNPMKKFTVGRRSEIKEMVSFILTNRFVNLYGPCGIGKTTVLRRMAQYLHERKIFKGGVIYLDICMRTDIIFIYRYLAGILNISMSDKGSLVDDEKLINSLKNLEILLIIDNIDRLDNKEKIVIDISKIMSDTDKPKFILGSQSCLGKIGSYNHELIPLTQNHSIKLLSLYNNLTRTEMLEKIVSKVGKNPADLIQISPILFQSILCQSILDKPSSENISIEFSLAYIEKEFPNILDFLKLLSYFPSGALKINLELLCEEKCPNYISILDFLCNDRQTAWFIHTDENYSFTVLRSNVMHYMTYISPHNQDLAKACLIHLAVFSRGILKAYLKSSDPIRGQYRSSLFFINAGIDHGIWRAAFPKESKKILEKIESNYKELGNTFDKIESNFWYYLNKNHIKEIFQNTPLEKEIILALGEIMICTTAIFIMMGKIEDALIMIKRGRDLCSEFKMKTTKALLYLTNASLYSSSKFDKNLVRNFPYARKKLDKALDFTKKAKKKFSDSQEGLVESNFLNILLRLKIRLLAGSLPVLKRAQSSSIEEDAAIEQVIADFNTQGEKVGSARAMLGYGKFMLKIATDDRTINYLKDSIIIFNEEGFPYWKTKAQLCLSKCYYEGSNWIESRKILNEIEITQKDLNRVLINEQLNKVNDKIKSNNKHFISFFFASPLVSLKSNQIKKARPISRGYQETGQLLEGFISMNRQFCLRTEILTRENFKKYLEDKPMVLHLSSTAFDSSCFVFENEEGATDLVDLEKFKEICGFNLKTHGVELLVLAMPLSAELGMNCYLKLEVSHVICFNLFDYTEDCIPVHISMILERLIFLFCSEFYLQLLEGTNIKESFDQAKEKMKIALKGDLQAYGQIMIGSKSFEEIWEEESFGPILINPESSDHLDMPCLQIPEGEPIIMNLPNGPCNISKPDISRLVGRHTETYRLVQEIKSTKCVIVEGQKGIGKTEFVKHAGFYLNSRREFLGNIIYLDLLGQTTSDELYQELQKHAIVVHPSYSASNSKILKNTLIILDNTDELYLKSMHVFIAIINYLKDCQISLIITSSFNVKWSENFKAAKIQLGPLNDSECRVLILLKSAGLYQEFFAYSEADKECILPLIKLLAAVSKRVPGEVLKRINELDLFYPVKSLNRLKALQKAHGGPDEMDFAYDPNLIREDEEELETDN